MKYLFLILVFFGIWNFSFGQDDKFIQDFRKQFNDIKTDTAKLTFLDSLENKIAYFQNPILSEEILSFATQYTQKVKSTPHYKGLAYAMISNYYLGKYDLSNSVLYSDSALFLLKGISQYGVLYSKAQALILMGKRVECKTILSHLLNQKDVNTRTKFISNRLLAQICMEESNFDSAYLFLDRIDEIAKEEKNEEYRINSLDAKFLLYYRLKKQDSIFYIFKEIEKYRLKVNEKDNLAKLYSNMGGVYKDYKKYEEAMKYYKKAMDIKQELGSKDIGVIYYNISVLYDNKDDKKMIFYLKKSIESYEKVGDLEGIAYSKETLAFTQAQLKFKQNASDYTEEINMEKEAFNFFKEQNSDEKIIGTGSYLCQILLLAGKNKEAAELLKELKKYPTMGLLTRIRLDFTEIKVKMALQNVDIKYIDEIGKDMDNLLLLQDSSAFLSYDTEVPRKLAELEAEKAQLDKKQQELENQLTKEELRTSQLTTVTSIGIGTLLLSLLGGLFFIRNQRAKRKQAELEVQNQTEQRKVAELELENQKTKQKETELQSRNKEIAFRLEKTKTEMENRITEERNQVFTKSFEDIAYYIHNEAGGKLTLAINELDLLSTNSNNEETQNALKELRDLKEKFRNITRIFENIEEVGTLQFRLEQYNRLIAKNNPSIFFEYEVEIPQLTTEIKGNKAKDIYFIIQEFVENSIKYAEASKISVIIEIDEDNEKNQKNESDNLLIKITDDGKGFDTQTTKTSGIKLTTRKIEELGGNIIISSSSTGTQIEMRFPNTKEDTTNSIEIDLKSI